MPAHGGQRVDEFAPGDAVAHAPPVAPARRVLHTYEGGPNSRPLPPEGERHAERRRPCGEEGQVEAEEVVVLDDVGIARADEGAEIGDEGGLVGDGGGLQEHLQATAVAHRHEEDAPLRGRERGRLQVDLQPVQIVVGQAAEVEAASRHQVLLDGTDGVVVLWQVA